MGVGLSLLRSVAKAVDEGGLAVVEGDEERGFVLFFRAAALVAVAKDAPDFPKLKASKSVSASSSSSFAASILLRVVRSLRIHR